MIEHSKRSSSRGAALLLTLWCVAVVSVAVVMAVRLVDFEVGNESIRSRRFEARELALTGLAHGMNSDLKRDNELLHQQFPDGNKLDVLIMSENARLNINLLLAQPDHLILKNLFEIWGIPDDERRIAIDSLADWVDEGDLRRLNGAESDDLKAQKTYSLPQNRSFKSVAEMRRVRGMDAVSRAKPNWSDFFSVHSGEKIDIQDAHPDILRAVAGMSTSQAKSLEEFRNGQDETAGTADDNYIKALEDLERRVGLNETQMRALQAGFQVSSEPSRIQSTAVAGGTQYKIVIVANRKEKAVSILSWEEQ